MAWHTACSTSISALTRRLEMEPPRCALYPQGTTPAGWPGGFLGGVPAQLQAATLVRLVASPEPPPASRSRFGRAGSPVSRPTEGRQANLFSSAGRGEAPHAQSRPSVGLGSDTRGGHDGAPRANGGRCFGVGRAPFWPVRPRWVSAVPRRVAGLLRGRGERAGQQPMACASRSAALAQRRRLGRALGSSGTHGFGGQHAAARHQSGHVRRGLVSVPRDVIVRRSACRAVRHLAPGSGRRRFPHAGVFFLARNPGGSGQRAAQAELFSP